MLRLKLINVSKSCRWWYIHKHLTLDRSITHKEWAVELFYCWLDFLVETTHTIFTLNLFVYLSYDWRCISPVVNAVVYYIFRSPVRCRSRDDTYRSQGMSCIWPIPNECHDQVLLCVSRNTLSGTWCIIETENTYSAVMRYIPSTPASETVQCNWVLLCSCRSKSVMLQQAHLSPSSSSWV